MKEKKEKSRQIVKKASENSSKSSKENRRGSDGKQLRARREPLHIEFEKKQKTNPYYKNISSLYKWLKIGAIAVMLVYLIVMMCIYRTEITYDNLMYLVKDLDTDISVTDGGFEDISYETNGQISTGIFKNRLVVADMTKATFYNTAGAAELESFVSLENPEVLCGDKYTLIYDIGGNRYSIYTTITKVLDKESEFELQGATLSDGGSFAIITRSRENRYLVDFFDENFKEVSRVYKDKYVMDVALTDNGKSYAVVSADIQSSDFVSEVMIGTVGSEEYLTTQLSGMLPLSVEVLDVKDGKEGSVFAVVCDGGIYFFSSAGERMGEYVFSGMNLQYASAYGDKILLCGTENLVGSSSKAVLLDSTGAEIYKNSFAKKINRIAMGENHMFLLFENEFCRISTDGTAETSAVEINADAMLPFGDNAVLCTKEGALMAAKAAPAEE